MKATWNGKVIAESNDIVEVEGNAYFPLSSIHRDYFKDSSTHTTCTWKGRASYFVIDVDGNVNRDAAWTYPTPLPGAEAVTDRVAFWRGVKVSE